MSHCPAYALRLVSALLVPLLPACLLGCGDNYVSPGAGAAGSPATATCPLDPTLVPSPEDLDGDGLRNEAEVAGYRIVVDAAGLGVEAGQLEERLVTSDPECADTDGDGLQDGVEAFFKTDPRSKDTDGDGLSDGDEIRIWKTSPTSADTDGDATGPDGLSAPNPLLFDGSEVEALGTSPSLADTDGDSATDFEEADDPLRHPLIAELPSVTVELAGLVDIRLRVSYAEREGEESTYGEEMSTTDSSTRSSTNSTSTATTIAGSGGQGFLKDVTAGAATGGKAGAALVLAGPVMEARRKAGCDIAAGKGVKVGPISFNQEQTGIVKSAVGLLGSLSGGTLGPKATGDKLCGPTTPQTIQTVANALTAASTRSAQQSYSTYLTESRDRTETTSGGSVRVGATLTNTGPVAVGLDDVLITMLQWQQSPSTDPTRDANGAPTDNLGAGLFRTMATLRPKGLSLTLSPGEQSEVIELAAEDLNPDVIKGFLSRPNSIVYAPANIELANADGVNFKFLTEKTYGRTASIAIDYGDGRVDNYQVATNVRRTPDGDLAGVTLGHILENIIGVDFEMVEDMRSLPGSAPGVLTPVRALQRIGDKVNDYGTSVVSLDLGVPGSPRSIWVVYPTTEAQADPALNFDDIIVNFGDEIRLVYTVDRDGDGLYAAEEALYGTSDSPFDERNNRTGAPGPDGIIDGWDSDGDGLYDYFETKIGWVVTIDTPDPTDENPTYRVFSDPTQSDADQDGIPDRIEGLDLGTDPNNPDTDDDGLPELDDLLRTRPAGRYYVRADAPIGGDGRSWATAFNSLWLAMNYAVVENDDANSFNDVSEIWVATGDYSPPTGRSFELGSQVTVYGGFLGTEATLGARNADPLTNGTFLVGNPQNTNEPIVLSTGFRGALDGFALVEGLADTTGAALRVVGTRSIFRGLYFANNRIREEAGYPITFANQPPVHSRRGAGGAVSVFSTDATFEDCTFVGNEAAEGGAVYVQSARTRFERCSFIGNLCGDDYRNGAQPGLGGGALEFNVADNAPQSTLDLIECSFVGNACAPGIFQGTTLFGRDGGALLLRSIAGGAVPPPRVNIERCRFDQNSAGLEGKGGAIMIGGGSYVDVSITGSRFFGNRARRGLAVYGTGDPGLTMSHCTVAGNVFDRSLAVSTDPLQLYTLRLLGLAGGVRIDSCIIAQNGVGGVDYEVREIWAPNANGGFDLRYTCTEKSDGLFGGPTNFFYTNPAFLDLGSGDLRLDVSSPCIDRGNNFADVDHATPGIQVAGPLDLLDQTRRVDHDGDGSATMDMGAYEKQR